MTGTEPSAEQDRALARRGTSARVGEVEPAVAVGAEQHPLADAGNSPRRARRAVARSAAARLVAPRVVAEERRGARRQLVALPGHLHPALAHADELVGGALAEQPTVDACDLHGVLVRQHRAVAQHVAGDAVVVVLEHEAQRLHRLDDLDAQRSDAVVVHVGSQPTGQPDVVLSVLVADAHEAVENVVVLVQPDVGGQAHVAVEIAEAHVVAVVPL